MKKSNKLILGGFLIGLLQIAAIHITLYAKYKNGDYTIYNSEEELIPTPMQLFPNILIISINNLEGTVKFTEVAEVEKGQEEYLSYVRKGDTLVITGKDRRDNGGARRLFTFNLPYNATMTVNNSSLYFNTGKQSVENNPVFYLNNASVIFEGKGKPFQIGNIKVDASDKSAMLFQGNTQVNQIDARLSNSTFEYGEGNLGQLNIETDSVSRISLPSRHLTRAKINNVSRQ